MIAVLRRLGRTRAYVPFVVVTNWCLAAGLTVLALPGCLLLGLATPGLAELYAAAFGWWCCGCTPAPPGRSSACRGRSRLWSRSRASGSSWALPQAHVLV